MNDYNQKKYTTKLFRYITKEKKDVGNIYTYAILSGLVQLSIPLGIQSIVNLVLGASMVTSIYLLIIFVVLGTWLVGVFRVRVMQIIEKILQKIMVEFSITFTDKLPKIDLAESRKYYLPELVNRFFDIPNLQKGIAKILLEIPTAIIQILFGIILLSFYHVWFLVFGVLVVLIIAIILKYTMEKGINTSIAESDKKYEIASWIEDIATSIKTFKLNANTTSYVNNIDEKVVDYLQKRTTHFNVLVLQYKTIIAFKVIITAVMLMIGTYLLVNQKLNLGAFIATEIVVLTIMSAVEKLIKSLESYYDVITSFHKLDKITSLPEEKNGEITMDSTNEGIEIEFKNASFRFRNDKNILENINCVIPKNSLTVVSGSIGSGKTLFLNMISGFYEPSEGSILFNKIPLYNLTKSSIRKNIALFFEDTTLIKATVTDNILLGNTNVTIQDILHTIEAIGIENPTNQFTQGFLTPISETHTEISYSSKKIILLLRAIVGEKKVWLLEDPFEGMDTTFCSKFTQYLKKMSQNTTIIIVTKDQKLIEMSDSHLTLQDGTLKKVK